MRMKINDRQSRQIQPSRTRMRKRIHNTRNYIVSAYLAYINACLHHLVAEASVYLFNYLEYTGKSSSEQVYLPAFESLAHYSMVSVGNSSCNDIP